MRRSGFSWPTIADIVSSADAGGLADPRASRGQMRIHWNCNFQRVLKSGVPLKRQTFSPEGSGPGVPSVTRHQRPQPSARQNEPAGCYCAPGSQECSEWARHPPALRMQARCRRIERQVMESSRGGRKVFLAVRDQAAVNVGQILAEHLSPPRRGAANPLGRNRSPTLSSVRLSFHSRPFLSRGA